MITREKEKQVYMHITDLKGSIVPCGLESWQKRGGWILEVAQFGVRVDRQVGIVIRDAPIKLRC